jgi:hypothetical protein
MMMIRNKDSYYSEITSFEDLRLERTRLILKSRLLETRINMNLDGILEAFSLSTLALSLAKEYILPKIADILGLFSQNSEKDAESQS